MKRGNRRLYDFCDEFEAHIETRTRPRTVKLYKTALAKAKASWGDIKLGQIDEGKIDAFITDMARAGLKPPTVNKNLRHLKGALKKAYNGMYLQEPIQFRRPSMRKKSSGSCPLSSSTLSLQK